MSRLVGAVVGGAGEGAGFVALEWFRAEVERLAGFEPYPGTLNLRLVDTATLDRWRGIRDERAVPVATPSPEQCGGRLVSILIADGIPAAVVVPDITRYGEDVVEVVAADHLRTRLGLRDGDRVVLAVP